MIPFASTSYVQNFIKYTGILNWNVINKKRFEN